VVSVDHPGGLRTTYEPVTASVHAGDPVALGSPLGVLEPGHPVCALAACLHWGLRRGAVYLDPLLLLKPLRVRLKPL
jgi:murein DD-endopeptidase MepM/ murein hydrolase activator NlpD